MASEPMAGSGSHGQTASVPTAATAATNGASASREPPNRLPASEQMVSEPMASLPMAGSGGHGQTGWT